MPSSKPLQVIEVDRVSPLANSPDSGARLALPLTFFDIAHLKLHPIEVVFFYRLSESSRSFFDSVILPRLKSSLSLALHSYLPLSGHLIWDLQEPKPSVVYSQEGSIFLTVAQSEADFQRLAGNEPRQAAELHLLVPGLPVSDNLSPIISLQITLFPNQGFCIGVTAEHAVFDGQTLAMFLNAWAHMCRHEQENKQFPSLLRDLTPSLDRTVITDPTRLDMKLLNAFLSSFSIQDSNKRRLRPLPAKEVSPDVVQATFELTQENIKKLRERIKNVLSQEYSKEIHLSNFVITYAYVLTCMVRARGGGTNRPVCFGFAVDYRSRLNPPVQSTYFGNCVRALCNFNAKAGIFMEEKGLVSAVKMVSDLVTGLGSRSLETMYDEMYEIIEGFGLLKPGTQVGAVAGATWLRANGLDFGWGKPSKMEFVSLDENGTISFTESRDGNGGVEIGLRLKRLEMRVFASLFVDGIRSVIPIRSSL